jgi:hypothetical protein
VAAWAPDAKVSMPSASDVMTMRLISSLHPPRCGGERTGAALGMRRFQ